MVKSYAGFFSYGGKFDYILTKLSCFVSILIPENPISDWSCIETDALKSNLPNQMK